MYWGGGMYTRLACSLATILAGFMAAGLRKLMFDNKKPTWSYGICIAVVCEVIHMILIFLTNMDNSSQAFEFVKGATAPMMLGNSVAVGASILLISLFSHERFFRKKTTEGIAHTFQRRLLSCIVIAYLITSTFTLILQNGMAQIETQEVFTVAINDVEAAVREKSNHQLLEIAEQVKVDYEKDPTVSLSDLTDKYGIKEINIVASNGIIKNSTEADSINYDMNSKAQSKEFVDVLKVQDSFVQDCSPRGKDESVWRKYAPVNFTGGGFIQVGYDAERFHKMLNEFVIDVTYLMGDNQEEYELVDPCLEATDAEGYQYGEDELPAEFDTEIISWEYPEPIENTFVFAGFSALYSVNMGVMLLAGLLTLLICVILVKKSEEVSYSVLDKIGIVLNFIGVFAVLPIISLAACLIQAYPTGPDWIYQAYLCVPPIIVFSIAASVALRRRGFGKSGFFVQFLGIIVEVILAVLEYAL